MKALSSLYVSEYHAHVYFQESTRKAAYGLYEALGERFGSEIHRNSMADGPRGPHVPMMFGIDIPKTSLESVLSFLIVNHGQHSILFHPVTGHELLDHTHHALWLGQPQPLDLSALI